MGQQISSQPLVMCCMWPDLHHHIGQRNRPNIRASIRQPHTHWRGLAIETPSMLITWLAGLKGRVMLPLREDRALYAASILVHHLFAQTNSAAALSMQRPLPNSRIPSLNSKALCSESAATEGRAILKSARSAGVWCECCTAQLKK